jgi:hypothetical protein
MRQPRQPRRGDVASAEVLNTTGKPAMSTMTAGVARPVVRDGRAWLPTFSPTPSSIMLSHLVVTPHSVPRDAEWCSCPAGAFAQDHNVDLSASSSSGSNLRPCDYTEPPLSVHASLSAIYNGRHTLPDYTTAVKPQTRISLPDSSPFALSSLCYQPFYHHVRRS